MKLKTRAESIVHKFYPNVTRVVDAKRPTTIEVTPRDTSSARVKNHKACALAVACSRTLHLDGAIIAISRAYLIRGDVATRYELSPIVSREITSFDRGGSFSPGVYSLGKVYVSHKQGPKKGHGGRHTGTRPKPRHVTDNIRTALTA